MIGQAPRVTTVVGAAGTHGPRAHGARTDDGADGPDFHRFRDSYGYSTEVSVALLPEVPTFTDALALLFAPFAKALTSR